MRLAFFSKLPTTKFPLHGGLLVCQKVLDGGTDHTHSLTHTHTHSNTLTHTLTRVHTHTHAYPHTHTGTHTHTRVPTHTHGYPHTHTGTHTHTQVPTHTHAPPLPTHTHTHTLIYISGASPLCSFWLLMAAICFPLDALIPSLFISDLARAACR